MATVTVDRSISWRGAVLEPGDHEIADKDQAKALETRLANLKKQDEEKAKLDEQARQANVTVAPSTMESGSSGMTPEQVKAIVDEAIAADRAQRNVATDPDANSAPKSGRKKDETEE